MSLPAVTITGNLTADPELKFTNSGVARVSFTVAASERKKNDNGQWEDGDTTFLRVTAWRQVAENCAETLTKGSPVVVVGRLRSRKVEDKTYFDLDADTVGLDLRRAIGAHEGSSKKDDPWSADSVPF